MQNPVPEQYIKNYIGCRPNPIDQRDITLGDIPYIPDNDCPSFKEGFDVENALGIRFKREHQGPSSSCVGQAWSKYEEIIDICEMIGNIFFEKYGHTPNPKELYEFSKTVNIETIKSIIEDLSAKDVYSQIYQPQGGAYIRDGAKLAVNVGITLEKHIPSYEDGNPPTEAFMRHRGQTDESIKTAKTYRARKYVHLPVEYPLRAQDWEDVRQVIYQFRGFVSGYGKHCIYFKGYGIDPNNGLRFIKYINSYGDKFGEDGTGKWFENYGQRLFDVTFLYDQPNKIIMTTEEKRALIINIHHELLCREADNIEIERYAEEDEAFIRKDVGQKPERQRIISVVSFARAFKIVNK